MRALARRSASLFHTTAGPAPRAPLAAQHRLPATGCRSEGQYEDMVARVTNFHNEDKGHMVLDGDVFDVPIRKDIVHRVVRWQLAKRQQLLVFEDLQVPSHKTKNIVNYISQMDGTKKVLLVDGGDIDKNLKLATQNLHYVNVLPSLGLNVYSILQHDTLVMTRDAVNRIVDRMHTPINR
ncbi:hypothetical protein ACP70R_033106 [Stipagrostis hirtigluma subsp. patula]